MTSRYVPNEAACPVPVELLAELLLSDRDEVARAVEVLPVAQRAALAGFCFSRSHMRSLSFVIAAQCDPAALRAMTGQAAEALIEHSRNPGGFDEGPKVFNRRVSLVTSRPSAR